MFDEFKDKHPFPMTFVLDEDEDGTFFLIATDAQGDTSPPLRGKTPAHVLERLARAMAAIEKMVAMMAVESDILDAMLKSHTDNTRKN